MVECKYENVTVLVWMYSVVLIDTWWNVNYEKVRFCLPVVLVLIDTWWNVNILYKAPMLLYLRFNRYMVECKSF